MARLESDREDLLAEASAYPRRGECHWGETVVFAGSRENGAVSVYFDGDPVYHLDPDARLRRAVVDGNLYRTQGTTLARLRRHRTDERTELLRHDLTDDELATFLDATRLLLRSFVAVVDAGMIDPGPTIPTDFDPWPVVAEVLHRFLVLAEPLAPAIAGRK